VDFRRVVDGVGSLVKGWERRCGGLLAVKQRISRTGAFWEVCNGIFFLVGVMDNRTGGSDRYSREGSVDLQFARKKPSGGRILLLVVKDMVGVLGWKYLLEE
jgi:hypothetical protein